MNSRRYVDGKLVEDSGRTAHWDSVEHGRPLKAVAKQPVVEIEDIGEKVAAILEERAAPAPVPTIYPAPQRGDSQDITDTAGLRRFLLKQMVAASKGEIDTERTRNVCAIVQQIYQATKLELEAARLLSDGTKSIRAIELTDDSGD